MGKRGRPPHPDILTPREWQVLDLLRQNLTNEQIAHRLDISPATAKYHVSEILSKLGVQTREEAAAWQPPAALKRPWWARATGPIAVALRRIGPVPAIVGALATLAVLATVAWAVVMSNRESEPSVRAQETPSASALPTPSTSASATATRQPTPRPELPPSRNLTFQPNEVGRYFRGLYERLPDDVINLLVENPAFSSRDPFSVSQDGRRLAFAYRGTVYRHERGGGEPPVPVVSFRTIRDIALSPDGSRALVSGHLYEEGPEVTFMVDMLSGSLTGFHPEGHKPSSPSWSPDGAWIAFWEGTCENPATYIVASDGTGLRRIADRLAESAWSPDGQRLALAGHCLGEPGIWLFDLGTGPIDLGGTIPSSSGSSSWSPDGRLLSFVTLGEIHVIDTETRQESVVARGAEPTWSPDGSALAFTRDGNIYISNLDGSSQSQVTFPTQPFTGHPKWLPDGSLMFAFAPPFEWAVYAKELATGLEVDLADGREPLWSPDGTRISFVAGASLGQGGSVDINVMAPDGEALIRVGGQNWDDGGITCEEGQSISWSPDGRTIAFSDGVEARISQVDVTSGSAPVVMVAGHVPAWSSEGSRLAYSSFDERGCIIRLLSPSDPRDDNFLTVGSMSHWSPDGRKLAFVRSRTDHYLQDVFVIAADGTGERQLTFPRGEGLKAAFRIGSWSPDSTRLAFTRFPLTESGIPVSNWQSGEIVIVDTDTGESRRLLNGSDPVWSPDGSQIAFIRWDDDLPISLTPYIYVVDAEGAGEPALFAQGEHPSWSPDGTRIAFTRYLNQ